MNLSLEFEAVRAALMNREVSLDLDTCIQVVLCLKEKKEWHQKSHTRSIKDARRIMNSMPHAQKTNR